MQSFDKHISMTLLLMLGDDSGIVFVNCILEDRVVRKDNCWVHVSQYCRKKHLIKAACLSQLRVSDRALYLTGGGCLILHQSMPLPIHKACI